MQSGDVSSVATRILSRSLECVAPQPVHHADVRFVYFCLYWQSLVRAVSSQSYLGNWDCCTSRFWSVLFYVISDPAIENLQIRYNKKREQKKEIIRSENTFTRFYKARLRQHPPFFPGNIYLGLWKFVEFRGGLWGHRLLFGSRLRGPLGLHRHRGEPPGWRVVCHWTAGHRKGSRRWSISWPIAARAMQSLKQKKKKGARRGNGGAGNASGLQKSGITEPYIISVLRRRRWMLLINPDVAL